jgi:hypothetical protein
VLEQIFGVRRHAVLEDEAGFDKPAQRALQIGLGELSGRRQQLVGEVAPDRGADLCRLLRRRTEPVDTLH